MQTTETTIETLAAEAGSYFTDGPRVSTETGRTIRVLKDDRPDWVQELIFAAHGDMGPDDWRYEMIEEALSAIENDGDNAEPEADIYTHELTKWLASSNYRLGYCDDAVSEFGNADSTSTLLQWGQSMERREIISALIDGLNERLSEVETDEEDTENDD